MNLFWDTRRLTNSRENHLTEFFAAALTLSHEFRSVYAQLVLTEFAQRKGWEKPAIAEVETQVSYPGTSCQPDMRLRLMDGHVVLAEHKLDALETMGPESNERDQLRRYLELPVDGVIYVRASWKPPGQDVLDHPAYIRPHGREHFQWRDFYPLLPSDGDLFLSWLREGFEHLGFTPPHPAIGDLNSPDPEACRANRQNFAKLWSSIRSLAHDLGWTVGTGAIAELYLWNSPSKHASEVFISPTRAERFLVRVTPTPGSEEVALGLIRKAAEGLQFTVEVDRNIVNRKQGRVPVIDIKTTILEILGEEEQSTAAMEGRLLAYISGFLQALQKS
jgi:hypothetical protein